VRCHSRPPFADAGCTKPKLPAGLGARLAIALATSLLLAWLLASTALAAGRAYELASPADKGGTDVASTVGDGTDFMPTAAADGSRVAFNSLNAMPGAVANGFVNSFEAERESAAWQTDFLSPRMEPVFGIGSAVVPALSSDLGKVVVQFAYTPALTPGAPEGTKALYLLDKTTGEYRLLTPGAPSNSEEFEAEVVGASEDFSRIVMEIRHGGALTPDTPGGTTPLLYEWSAATGELTLVGRLPGNSVFPGADDIARPSLAAGTASPAPWNPVSADGSHIFFTGIAGNRQLYVRVGEATTHEVSESQRSPVDPEGPRPAEFRFASSDGSAAFFTSSEKLTNDATTGTGDVGSDLYLWKEAGASLTDITVDGTDENGAQVQGVIGGAADGSRLYFVAQGVLAAGATAGQENLYVWSQEGGAAGTIRFVAGPVSNVNWTSNAPVFGNRIPSRVSADGEHLLFESKSSPTGYADGGHYEAYLYDAETGHLACASCNPRVSPATADALAVGAGDYTPRARTLSADGRHVFFTSAEQLVPADTNAAADVYEYDAESGEIVLISSGKAETPSLFSDASESGTDVFFTTRQQLVGIDQDENTDVYDARVGGGIAAQNPAPAAPPCTGSECRVPGTASLEALTPGSSQQNGPGDQKHKRRHKKKHRRKGSRGKRAGANRHASH
jgi:Tol biopolymer transport system component